MTVTTIHYYLVYLIVIVITHSTTVYVFCFLIVIVSFHLKNKKLLFHFFVFFLNFRYFFQKRFKPKKEKKKKKPVGTKGYPKRRDTLYGMIMRNESESTLHQLLGKSHNCIITNKKMEIFVIKNVIVNCKMLFF